jgi:hypothetical protein
MTVSPESVDQCVLFGRLPWEDQRAGISTTWQFCQRTWISRHMSCNWKTSLTDISATSINVVDSDESVWNWHTWQFHLNQWTVVIRRQAPIYPSLNVPMGHPETLHIWAIGGGVKLGYNGNGYVWEHWLLVSQLPNYGGGVIAFLPQHFVTQKSDFLVSGVYLWQDSLWDLTQHGSSVCIFNFENNPNTCLIWILSGVFVTGQCPGSELTQQWLNML